MNILDIVKYFAGREPARLVSYATIAAIWAVVKVSALAGAPIAADGDVALAVGTIVTFIVTELIRRLVYAPATVAAMGTPVAVEVAGENDTV